MFEWLLHAGTRQKMLKMFFKTPEKPLYGLEIAQILKTSPGTIHRELNSMVKQGILLKKSEGALIMYRLNSHHPYFSELKKSLFPKKKDQRVLLLSGLKLSLHSKEDLLDDLRLLLQYAEENASELVLLGDVLDMFSSDVFKTYVLEKPLFDQINQLAHQITVTIVPGLHDRLFELFAHDNARVFDSPIRFLSEYHHEGFGIFASYPPLRKFEKPSSWETVLHHCENQKKEGMTLYQHKLKTLCCDHALAHDVAPNKDHSYCVVGGAFKPSVKESHLAVVFHTGSWADGNRCFVEIDSEGGALVTMEELKKMR